MSQRVARYVGPCHSVVSTPTTVISPVAVFWDDLPVTRRIGGPRYPICSRRPRALHAPCASPSHAGWNPLSPCFGSHQHHPKPLANRSLTGRVRVSLVTRMDEALSCQPLEKLGSPAGSAGLKKFCCRCLFHEKRIQLDRERKIHNQGRARSPERRHQGAV